MYKKNVTIIILMLSGLSFVLSGCDSRTQELEEIKEKAEQAEAESQQLKSVVAQLKTERDKLQESVTMLELDINEVESELFLYRQNQGNIEIQASEIIKERDAAIANAKRWQESAEELSVQLKDSRIWINLLEDQVAKLQSSLAEYEESYSADEEYVEEELYEEEYEEVYEEEYEDPNAWEIDQNDGY
jgi:chromosome segregation ATPase